MPIVSTVNGLRPGQSKWMATNRTGSRSLPGSSKTVTDGAAPPADRTETPTRPVTSVGVVGSGTMATGIIEVFAKAGFSVIAVARSEEKAAAALARVASSLNRAVSKSKMNEGERDAALARITPVAEVAALAEVDLVVEAIAEDLPAKQALFAELDSVVKPGAVLATTTSSSSRSISS